MVGIILVNKEFEKKHRFAKRGWPNAGGPPVRLSRGGSLNSETQPPLVVKETVGVCKSRVRRRLVLFMADGAKEKGSSRGEGGTRRGYKCPCKCAPVAWVPVLSRLLSIRERMLMFWRVVR